MSSIHSHSLEETQKIAGDWLGKLAVENHEPTEATVVGLSGPLGSGKTTFIQSVARILGVKETVASPTFVIMKFYATEHKIFNRLVHIDAYRLEHAEELQGLGFEDIVADPNNLVLIEWAVNVKEILPENTRWIRFEHAGENERKITFVSPNK